MKNDERITKGHKQQQIMNNIQILDGSLMKIAKYGQDPIFVEQYSFLTEGPTQKTSGRVVQFVTPQLAQKNGGLCARRKAFSTPRI